MSLSASHKRRSPFAQQGPEGLFLMKSGGEYKIELRLRFRELCKALQLRCHLAIGALLRLSSRYSAKCPQVQPDGLALGRARFGTFLGCFSVARAIYSFLYCGRVSSIIERTINTQHI